MVWTVESGECVVVWTVESGECVVAGLTTPRKVVDTPSMTDGPISVIVCTT